MCLCSLFPVFLRVVLFIYPRCSHSVVSSSVFSCPGVVFSVMVSRVVISRVVACSIVCVCFSVIWGCYRLVFYCLVAMLHL